MERESVWSVVKSVVVVEKEEESRRKERWAGIEEEKLREAVVEPVSTFMSPKETGGWLVPPPPEDGADCG